MQKNLHNFIEYLQTIDEIIVFDEFVNPILEISEITDRFSKQPGGGKALFFQNNGTLFPVVTNLMGSGRRIAAALNCTQLKEISDKIENLITTITTPPHSLKEKIKILSNLFQLRKIFPRYVSKGACQEVVHYNVDLNILPILKTWPLDAERFITLPIVHTKDALTGIRNVGMYRMQVLDRDKTAMHWHKHKVAARHFEQYKSLGIKMPIAVALGGDPVYTYVATAPLPDHIDEYLLAGFLRNEPVRLVKCLTQDIHVPSDADIILEGYIDPTEPFVLEGPFGDHTGFYSEPDYYPVFHITCITHKKNAIYPATVVGIPPQEDYYFAKATQTIFLPLIKKVISPDIVDFDLPMPGVAHNFAVVSIQNPYIGTVNKVANAIWGNGQLAFTKFIFVIDENLKTNDYAQILRTTLPYFDPQTDVFFSYGPMDVLEHASEKFIFGSKVAFDLTIKFKKAPHFSKIDKIDTSKLKYSDNQIVDAIDYLDYQIPICSIKLQKKQIVRKTAEFLINNFDFSNIKIIIFVDDIEKLTDFNTLAWLIGCNTAPVRDIFVLQSKTFDNSILIIDATQKTKDIDHIERNWPQTVKMDQTTITKVDNLLKNKNIQIVSPSLQKQ